MPTQSFRLFAQACLGVLVGALLALAIIRLALPADGRPASVPDGMLAPVSRHILFKPREKGFYLLTLMLGGMCAYFATFKILPGKKTESFLFLILILSVPIINQIASSTLAGASFLVPIFAALGAGGALLIAVHRYGRPLATTAIPAAAESAPKRRPYLELLGALTLMLVPSSFVSVAAQIGLNVHPVSFVIGPALYFLGNNLLPGIDYYSQYSIGFPWLFHFVMGNSAAHAVLVNVIIIIVATWLFYAHLIYLLQWLYRSWIAAATVASIPFILSFAYPSFGAPFFAPSSSILRYPLLTVCALLTGLWAESPAGLARLLPIAAVSGLSIFLETESGVIMLVSASLTILLIHPWRTRLILSVLAHFVVSLSVFTAILMAVFGSAAFQIEFFRHLFDGFIIYGGQGFGGAPVNWTLLHWSWLYNIVTPGALLATMAVIAQAGTIEYSDIRRSAVLGFLAASGLMLLAKYVNQSLAAVWQMSSVGPFSILGWWCIVLIRRIDPAMIVPTSGYIGVVSKQKIAQDIRGPYCSVRNASGVAMVVLALIFLLSASEGARNPAYYGLQAWARFPSLLKWPFAPPKGCIQMACLPDRPAISDTKLITSRTSPGEQVAIVGSRYDWTYLLAAHRPPLMFFLPSSETFTQTQLDESIHRIDRVDYLFVQKGPNNQPDISPVDLSTAVMPLLGTTYQKDGESDQLIVWKRASAPVTNGAH
jgi:hypothetical protein